MSKSLKLFLVFVILTSVLTLVTTSYSFLNASCITHNGFYVSGTKLMDKNGTPFVIRGITLPFAWYYQKSMNSLAQVKNTGANAVRIVWETDEDPVKFKKVIEAVVSNNMIAIPEFHDVPGNNDVETLNNIAKKWTEEEYRTILDEYQDKIILNIANEWGDWFMAHQFPEKWNEGYQKAIKTIRDAKIENTLMIDSCDYGNSVTAVKTYGNEVLQSDSLKNTMFSIHMYEDCNNLNLTKESETFESLGLCFLIGEFGYAGGRGITYDAQDILDTCYKKEVGYIPWLWSGNYDQTKFLDMTDSNDWTTLTKWGKWIIDGKNGIRETSKPCTVFE